MPGYDPNRPRPNGGDPFTGLPGDLPVNKPDSETRAPGVNEPDLTVTGAAEDETETTLQAIPQAVPPLDRRVPLMAVIGGLCGFAIIAFIIKSFLELLTPIAIISGSSNSVDDDSSKFRPS